MIHEVKDVFVHDLSCALGDLAIPIEESEKAGRLLSSAEQYRQAGFREHRICRPETSAYHMAREAVREIASELPGTGAIIYATCLPLNGNIGKPSEFERTKDVKHLMDFPVSHLQAEFKLDDASVIGLNQQACTSMIGSLRIARALLNTESELKQVLCVTSDRFPEGAIYEQAYNVISDGAAACLVSREPKGYKILASHAITNGALAQASDDETVGTYFSYTHRLLQETLVKAGLETKDIHWVIPQNTNVNAWVILSRLLSIDLDRVYFGTIGEVGHIISADNIVNLRKLEQTGKIKKGERLLLFMAGFGLNWQSIILEKV